MKSFQKHFDDARPLSLQTWLPYRMFIVAGRVAQTLAEFYGQTYGLSQAGWRILAIVADRPGANAQEIARASAFDQVTVSRGIAHLTGLGFAHRRRAANDRRYASVSLTPSGKAAYREIATLAAAAESRLNAVLTENEQTQLTSMLDRLEGASAGIEAAGWRALAEAASPEGNR